MAVTGKSHLTICRTLRAVLLTLVSAATLVASPAGAEPAGADRAEAAYFTSCRADASAKVGEAMVWRASTSGGSGSYAHSWSGTDGLTGSTAAVSKAYTAQGYKVARVVVTDQQSGQLTSAECGMHVVPATPPETPTVTPVLWVPRKSIDPAPLVPQLDRVMRSIRAGYYHMYGKTFALNPVRTIISSRSELDICGGDCTDQSEADLLMGVAQEDARAEVGVIPFARDVMVMAWGTGGFAGAFGWDRAIGGVGDQTVAPAAGLPVPKLEAAFNAPTWIVDGLGDYRRLIGCSLAHELNHSIGWDEPHDFCLGNPPTDYERRVVSGSPWMTEVPFDTVRPSIAFQAPSAGSTISGSTTVTVTASDTEGMDAVVFLVDGRYQAIDTSAPYSFVVDTGRMGFGTRNFTAIAYDLTGNTTEVSRDLVVKNTVSTSECNTVYPVGVFHVCFYDGIGTKGPYLGTLLDVPVWRSENVALAIDHGFSSGVAFGQTDTFTGVWRGKFNFPAGNYRFRFTTDDGLRFSVNGSALIDEWQNQAGYYEAIAALSGATEIEVQWYENDNGEQLRLLWGPTLDHPPGKSTVSVDVDGPGAVTSSPAGINCGLDCYESFPNGQSVTLTASPGSGAAFRGWTGDADCSDGVVTASPDKRCIATFDPGVASTPPVAPANTKATAVSETAVLVEWTDNSNNESVFEINNGSATRTAVANSGHFYWTGLSPGTRVCFRVRAVNIAGASAYMPLTVSCAKTPTAMVEVGSTVRWRATSVALTAGSTYSVSHVSGTWSVDYRNVPAVGPDGYPAAVDSGLHQGCKVVSSTSYGKLLARVGSGGVSVLSAGGVFTADSDGTLALRINDADACLGDNAGSVIVAVTKLSDAVDVGSTSGWKDTSITLGAGTTYTISSVNGAWSVDNRNLPHVGPEGYSSSVDSGIYQGCKVLSSATYGKLLGRIGSGSTFVVGPGGTFTAGQTGVLMLRINDSDGCLSDNAGSVRVRVATP